MAHPYVSGGEIYPCKWPVNLLVMFVQLLVVLGCLSGCGGLARAQSGPPLY